MWKSHLLCVVLKREKKIREREENSPADANTESDRENVLEQSRGLSREKAHAHNHRTLTRDFHARKGRRELRGRSRVKITMIIIIIITH